MKKGEKKKQQKALARRSERKQIQREKRQVTPGGTTYHIRHAREYPIEGCWTFEDWKEHGLTVVAVARRQPNQNIVYGIYLVDYYCLGVKNADSHGDLPAGQFYGELMPHTFGEHAPMAISPDLAHELVYGSIEYAAQFGFRPHRDFGLAQLVLDPPEAHPRTGEVEFGYEGKPLYIQGPYDDAEVIRRQLERSVGTGNYNFMVEVGPAIRSFEEQD